MYSSASRATREAGYAFDKGNLLPLVVKLGGYLRTGFDHYVNLRMAGLAGEADTVALFMEAQMSQWDPTIGGAKVMDAETRKAAARFIAGVATNMAKGQEK